MEIKEANREDLPDILALRQGLDDLEAEFERMRFLKMMDKQKQGTSPRW